MVGGVDEVIAPEHYEYLLFGTKLCATCGTPLPANSDFFVVDKWRGRCALKSECRACKAQKSKAGYLRRKDQERESRADKEP